MNSGRKLLLYLVLAAPSLALLTLLATIGLAVWVTAIIRTPARYDAAPAVVQKFARSVYWRHRTHWHTVAACVQFDESLLYKPKPGQCEFRNAEFAATLNFDERTLRRTAMPSVPTQLQGWPTAARLIVLGDSHAMGWGVADDETFPSVLASRYGVDALNLGVSSYGTARELLRLRGLGVLGEHDEILIQYCENDLEENAHFVSQPAGRRHVVADFERLLAYRAAETNVINVTVTLAAILRDDVVRNVRPLLSSRPAVPAQSAAAIFLQVLDQFPELKGRRILVTEVNAHGRASTFLRDLAALQYPNLQVIDIELPLEDFFRLDDHLTPRGQVDLARQIAQALGRT